ncbi:MAG: class I SAM-dependent methyltransferase [Nitrospirae bacterium]|nr:class I SAM-dependent methyltransferase [Nitrospirota bacterium]
MTDSLLPCPCGLAPLRPLKLGRAGTLRRCHRCGLLTRAQMPSDEDVTKLYREDYWQQYRDEQVGAARRNVHEHALAWLEQVMPCPGALVDVGCGGGALLALCRDRGWKGRGFDPSIQAAAYARDRGLDVQAEMFPPCSLADATVDVVTFMNVLDHLVDPFAALQEAWRVLRPGGLLYLRVPNGPFHAALLALPAVLRADRLAVFHLYGFGKSSLLHHLPRLGFDEIIVRTAPPSQSDPYGPSGEEPERGRSILKGIDQAGFHLLQGLGLTRQAWGPSLEALARKGSSGAKAIEAGRQGLR